MNRIRLMKINSSGPLVKKELINNSKRKYLIINLIEMNKEIKIHIQIHLEIIKDLFMKMKIQMKLYLELQIGMINSLLKMIKSSRM